MVATGVSLLQSKAWSRWFSPKKTHFENTGGFLRKLCHRKCMEKKMDRLYLTNSVKASEYKNRNHNQLREKKYLHEGW